MTQPDMTPIEVIDSRIDQKLVGIVTNRTPKLNVALSKVQAAIAGVEIKRDRPVTVIPKDKSKEPYSYSYATLATLTTIAFKLLGENGLSFTAWPGMASDGKGLSMRYSLRHESGETLDGEWPIAGAENLQTLGGRLTYLRRYALSAVLGLAAEEDDDAMAAMIAEGNEPSSVRATTPTRAATKAPARPNRRATPSAAEALPGGDPAAGVADQAPQGMLNHLFGLIGQLGFAKDDREGRLDFVSKAAGRPIATSKDLTREEAQAVIDRAQSEVDKMTDMALPTSGSEG